MNNGNQLKLKFTFTKVINLEMFTKVCTITKKYIEKNMCLTYNFLCEKED